MQIVDANIILRYLLKDIEELHTKAVQIEALDIYHRKNIDFVDSILISYNHINKDTIHTFDKKLNKLLGKR